MIRDRLAYNERHKAKQAAERQAKDRRDSTPTMA